MIGVATHVFEPFSGGTLYTWSMDFLPTGIGGRVTAALSAALLGRNAITQGERVRAVLEARQADPATDVAPRLELDAGARRKTCRRSITVELHDNSARNAGRRVGARAASRPKQRTRYSLR